MSTDEEKLKESLEEAMKQLHELQNVGSQVLGEIAKLQRAALEASIQRARESADLTNEQTKGALDNLESAMKSGSQFLQKFLRGQ
ncbi:MAG TPA: hypothetical protein VMD47_03085 [Candidatus Acidoferrales bacterium]|nr:hypothetical protein [Candidatus Acidoferrales bacterium]